MGYWYCKAIKKKVELKKVPVKGFFGNSIEEKEVIVQRQVEGKVLGMGNEGGYGSFDSIVIVVKEGKSPELVVISPVALEDFEEEEEAKDALRDEILELEYIED